MFGVSIFQLIIIGVVALIGIAWYAKGSKTAQAKLLDLLPDAGDRALLALQAHIPDSPELRAKARAALDAADAKADEVATDYLTKRGYTVTKS